MMLRHSHSHSHSHSRGIQGFTLIEMMVGIAIMAMVLLSSMSLGAGWIDEARVTDARSQMRLAYTKARAYALRNSQAGTGAVAWMCIASGVVYVYETGPTACGATDSVWQANLAGGTTTQVETAAAANSAAFACLALGNRGLPVAASIGTATCTTVPTLYVKRGNTNEATTLN